MERELEGEESLPCRRDSMGYRSRSRDILETELFCPDNNQDTMSIELCDCSEAGPTLVVNEKVIILFLESGPQIENAKIGLDT